MNKSCATCIYASKPTNKMGDAGFLRCMYQGDWEYRSPAAPCVFSPVRYVARNDAAKEAA